MIESMNIYVCALSIGIGATIVMDIWAWLMWKVFNIPSLNYAMVGRWLGHLPRGLLSHNNITNTPPIRGEAVIGWSAHYAIGILFAFILLSATGHQWVVAPSLLTAVLFGIITVAAPFFILQPALGAGIAASKTPHPNTARLKSLMAHTSYGIGLYISALAYSQLSG